jgi:hypothetical protein
MHGTIPVPHRTSVWCCVEISMGMTLPYCLAVTYSTSDCSKGCQFGSLEEGGYDCNVDLRDDRYCGKVNKFEYKLCCN